MAPKKTILKKRQHRARKLKGVKLDFDQLPPPAIPIADRTNSSPTTKKRRVTFADASTSPINTVEPLPASDVTTVATTPKEEMDIFAGIDPMDITDAGIKDIMSNATERQHLAWHQPMHVYFENQNPDGTPSAC
tara:strand:- start:8462 stop:8863 length:402 start_codon:yes stop_codon:yes gene_type:complete